MNLIILLSIFSLFSTFVLSEDLNFDIDFDYYESLSSVDIYKANRLKRGGFRRALQKDFDSSLSQSSSYGHDQANSYCVCDGYIPNNDGDYTDPEPQPDYPERCVNDLTVTDSDGIDCTWYESYPEYCGLWDDSDFTAADACCACGSSNEEMDVCHDDTSVKDSMGYGCVWYERNKEDCGLYDTQDFIANQACCSCKGSDEQDGGSDDSDDQDEGNDYSGGGDSDSNDDNSDEGDNHNNGGGGNDGNSDGENDESNSDESNDNDESDEEP